MSSNRRVSILQFNCLADALADSTFTHVSDPALLRWEHRRPLIERVLADLLCDFVCLDEVDHFDDFFLPFMKERGYDGFFFQRRHEENPISKDGVALFWNKNKYNAIYCQQLVTSSKTFGVLGRFKNKDADERLVVCALHLTAKPGREEDRATEIDLFCEHVGYQDLPILVGGDFNDVPSSRVCEMMRSKGFSSAYTHTEESWTTWKKRETEIKRVIDYIWYTGDAFEQVDDPYTHFQESIKEPIPDTEFPSDHIPLRAVFSFK